MSIKSKDQQLPRFTNKYSKSKKLESKINIELN